MTVIKTLNRLAIFQTKKLIYGLVLVEKGAELVNQYLEDKERLNDHTSFIEPE